MSVLATALNKVFQMQHRYVNPSPPVCSADITSTAGGKLGTPATTFSDHNKTPNHRDQLVAPDCNAQQADYSARSTF